MSSTQQIEATTTATSEKCIYKWTIKNYRLIKTKVGDSISSPEFSVGNDDKKYFSMKLFPAGDRTESAEFISIYLTYLRTDSTKNPDKIVCRSTISVINDNKVVFYSIIHQEFVHKRSWGWKNFFNLKDIDKLISSNNSITIQCDLEIFKEYESLMCSKIINKDETIDGVNLNSAFLSEELSDVRLITSDDSSIPAHKIILAMASPVFKAMFTHDMLESKKNSIEITDTPYNILVEMLRYIYTGDIASTTTDMILKLLAVADKYEINNLKSKCGKILCAELSNENAIEILIAAHRYDAKHLENEALRFVTVHMQSFVDTEKLKEITDHGVLLNIIQSITNSSR
ncbi:speckle-type POZ protein B-like [Trichogramma pretiosum]|uniref:speckle-type POZ protein B-like n=1 Tax=Trichogramma pretiosum TaxID=7493 RepID=UPI0006C9A6E6|nr:speckle-type POZ protein B-like [Trichogramma pretiosum]